MYQRLSFFEFEREVNLNDFSPAGRRFLFDYINDYYGEDFIIYPRDITIMFSELDPEHVKEMFPHEIEEFITHEGLDEDEAISMVAEAAEEIIGETQDGTYIIQN